MRRLALVPLAITLLLISPMASALGLGEIEMQSALNQSLDAEIPLRGVPEDDSDRIIVSLASEEAFRQVGLQRPYSLTRLRFQIQQHADGSYFVHVTTREPIVEPFLSFLIEVDWPGGNLLREYTVLLDPPVFVSEEPAEVMAEADGEAAAPAAEQEVMTATGVPAEIQREEKPEPEVAMDAEAPAVEAEDMSPAAEAAAEEDAMVPEDEVAAGNFSDTPMFLQVEQEEERAEAEARAMAEAEPEEAPTTTGYEPAGAEYGPVQRGEILWNIASRLKSADMTVQQMMLALLRYNPEAFVDDNINRLKQGYVLRIPEAGDVLSLSAQQAVAQVREQNSLWQEYRRTVRGGTGQAQQQASAGDTASVTTTGEDASLEIVGSEEGTGASSDQVASATGGGAAQPGEELKLAREQLESARMEKAELESRVEELEETVGKMERLIELREDQLAQLQDKLQQMEEGAAVEDVADEDVETAAGEDADEVAAEEETADTGAAEDTATAVEEDAETAAPAVSEEDRGVITERTQPREPDMLDQIMGVVGAIGGIFTGLGLGGLLSGPLALPILGGVGVLVLLGVMLAVRRRRAGIDEGEDEFEIDTGPVLAAGEEEVDEDFTAMFEEGGEDETVADDSGLAGGLEEDSTLTESAADTSDAEADFLSEAFDMEGLEEGDQTVATGGEAGDDDTIAEADVYLAYGLHQQAEELLNLAVEEQPDRVDYRAKLLEAIYGGGRADEFVTQAQALREKVADTNNPNWLRVVAMGKELAPDNELFQQEVDESLKPATSTATQPPETDLDLGGDEDSTELDFSFDEDEEAVDESDDDAFAQTMMLDSGEFEGAEGDAGLSGPEESGPEESAGEGADEEAMDFDLGDFDLDEEEPAVETESSPAEDEGADFDLSDFDLDEEEPAAETESSPAEDEGADFDLGDFDLGEETGQSDEASGEDEGDALADFDLGEEAEASEGESEDALADFDLDKEPEESGREGEDEFADFDLGEDEGAEIGESDLGALADEDEGSDDAEGFDFDLGEDEEASAGESGDDGESLDLNDETGLADMDLGELSDEGEEASAEEDSDAFDFDLSEEEGDAGAVEEEADLGGEDANLEDSGLEGLDDSDSADDADVSMDDIAADLSDDDSGLAGPVEEAAPESTGGGDEEDEYGTMLDLARAYIDMGDAESARSALEEVAESGNDDQRSEAQSLLDGI